MLDYRYAIVKARQQEQLKNDTTKILSFIKDNPNCTISQISRYFCIPCEKVSFFLRYLAKKGMITANKEETGKIIFWKAV